MAKIETSGRVGASFVGFHVADDLSTGDRRTTPTFAPSPEKSCPASTTKTGIETSVNGPHRMLRDIVSGDSQPLHDTAKPGKQFRSFMDSAKAARLLGWRLKTDLADGLRETLSVSEIGRVLRP